MKGPGHLIDVLYALARRGMSRPFSSTTKSAHTNPLRRLGEQMASLEARQVRVARRPKLVKGVLVNPDRREKQAIRRELGLHSGRAWRRWLKAEQRRERAA